jgi:hypothetical protein
MEGDIATSIILVDSELPNSVADYKGLPRCRWITKSVLLKDNNGEFVVVSVCHSVSSDLVVGSDEPLDLEISIL